MPLHRDSLIPPAYTRGPRHAHVRLLTAACDSRYEYGMSTATLPETRAAAAARARLLACRCDPFAPCEQCRADRVFYQSCRAYLRLVAA